MTRSERGTALAETALVIAFSLVIIFNGLQLALLGFQQMHSDFAAFIAARIYAVDNTNANPSSTATSAVQAAAPPKVTPQTSTSGNNALAIVQQTFPGLVMLGSSSSVTVQGEHLEPIPAPANVSQTYTFSVPTAFLQNYYSGIFDNTKTIALASHNIVLAQNVDTTGTGNGVNGVFSEWQSHDTCFATVGFPASYGNTQDGGGSSGPWTIDLTGKSGNAWVPKSKNWNASEKTIYGWDAGNPSNKGNTC